MTGQSPERVHIRRLDETCPKCHVIPFADCRNDDGSRRYGWLHGLTVPSEQA